MTSLSQTLTGLHWDRIPNDNDDEVAARGILYLLIFQQLGQLVRWSWGYHVLLAPKERYPDHTENASRIEQGQAEYTDNPDQSDPDEPLIRTRNSDDLHHPRDESLSDSTFPSGDETPVTDRAYSYSKLSDEDEEGDHKPSVASHQPHSHLHPNTGGMLSFPDLLATRRERFAERSLIVRWKHTVQKSHQRASEYWEKKTSAAFNSLPTPAQKTLSSLSRWTWRFFHGVWDFMNPPLWAMLISIIIASVPVLQRIFFAEGFVRNSVTMAVNQNGQVAVPLILVVLGANLARNTLPKEAQEDLESSKEERNLIVASLLARMLLPTLIMVPILALVAKYVPVSILDDPIFIIVCFLLTGAPSALQLAQICQINNVYVGAMSRLLFQSYVVW